MDSKMRPRFPYPLLGPGADSITTSKQGPCAGLSIILVLENVVFFCSLQPPNLVSAMASGVRNRFHSLASLLLNLHVFASNKNS